MKKFLLMAALFGAVTVQAQDKKADDVMKVNTEKHDFGKIKKGVPVTTEFEIKNTSNQPLVLTNVSASCGCTTPEWSKEPIPAGGTSKIKVGYNAAALNHFDKDVSIYIAGVSQPKVIKITGDVMEVAAYDAYAKGMKKVEQAKVQANTKTTSTSTPKKTKVKIKSGK
jgi:hypothetical protein